MSDYHYGFWSGAVWMYVMLWLSFQAGRLIKKYRRATDDQ